MPLPPGTKREIAYCRVRAGNFPDNRPQAAKKTKARANRAGNLQRPANVQSTTACLGHSNLQRARRKMPKHSGTDSRNAAFVGSQRRCDVIVTPALGRRRLSKFTYRRLCASELHRATPMQKGIGNFPACLSDFLGRPGRFTTRLAHFRAWLGNFTHRCVCAWGLRKATFPRRSGLTN